MWSAIGDLRVSIHVFGIKNITIYESFYPDEAGTMWENDKKINDLKERGYQTISVVNTPRKRWTFECRNHPLHNEFEGYISGIESSYLSYDSDRMFKFSCERGPIDQTQCEWKGYLNLMRGDITFKCRDGGVITGLHSKYNVNVRDRWWKVKCCKVHY